MKSIGNFLLYMIGILIAAFIGTNILAVLFRIHSDTVAELIFILFVLVPGGFLFLKNFNFDSRLERIAKKSLYKSMTIKSTFQNLDLLLSKIKKAFSHKEPFVDLPHNFSSTIAQIKCAKCGFAFREHEINKLAKAGRGIPSAYDYCPKCQHRSVKVSIDLSPAFNEIRSYRKNKLFYDCAALLREIDPKTNSRTGSGYDFTKVENMTNNLAIAVQAIANRHYISVEQSEYYLKKLYKGPRYLWLNANAEKKKKSSSNSVAKLAGQLSSNMETVFIPALTEAVRMGKDGIKAIEMAISNRAGREDIAFFSPGPRGLVVRDGQEVTGAPQQLIDLAKEGAMLKDIKASQSLMSACITYHGQEEINNCIISIGKEYGVEQSNLFQLLYNHLILSGKQLYKEGHKSLSEEIST